MKTRLHNFKDKFQGGLFALWHDIRRSCCLIQHVALMRKTKGHLARNQDNVSEWSNISIRGLFVSVSQYKADIIITPWLVTCSRNDKKLGKKNVHLALSNIYSLLLIFFTSFYVYDYYNEKYKVPHRQNSSKMYAKNRRNRLSQIDASSVQYPGLVQALQ